MIRKRSQRVKKYLFGLFISSFMLIALIPSANAGTVSNCHGAIINPLTSICWECMFPISIGSTDVGSGSLPDTPNPGNPICECPSGFIIPYYGLSTGYWEPMGLVDVSRTPYCMVNLGGIEFKDTPKDEGAVDTQSPDQNGSFYYVHYYNFPIMQYISSGLLGGACHTDGAISIQYLSELDPTWQDDKLAATVFPETLMFENPVTAVPAEIACAADSLKDNTGLPMDSTFWCAGSQGFMYPLNGNIAEQTSDEQASTLESERLMFKLHRIGLIQDTSESSLCFETLDLIMPKSRYRYQMAYPHKNACEPFGRTTLSWEGFQENPLKGDDAGYVIWRKRNCCNY